MPVNVVVQGEAMTLDDRILEVCGLLKNLYEVAPGEVVGIAMSI
jgi:hypothetical protein